MPALLQPVQTAAALTDSVIVGFSGGKDSVVTLDLCIKHFKRVEAYFLYYVPGLSFQERMLQWAEQRYGIAIYRCPHWELAEFMRNGVWRPVDLTIPTVSIKKFYAYLREHFGAYWIAGGERIADSIFRRATIKQRGTIDKLLGRIYPVAHFTKAHISAYIKINRLQVSEESRVLGFSFRSLQAKDMIKIRQHYPADFAKIKTMFPLVEAGIKHKEWYERTDQVPEV